MEEKELREFLHNINNKLASEKGYLSIAKKKEGYLDKSQKSLDEVIEEVKNLQNKIHSKQEGMEDPKAFHLGEENMNTRHFRVTSCVDKTPMGTWQEYGIGEKDQLGLRCNL